MGSCVSAQSEERRQQSKYGCSPDRSTTSSRDLRVSEPSVQEAIESSEKLKDKIENELQDLNQELEEARDERRRSSLQRTIAGKRNSLKRVEQTLKKLDKAMEKETEMENMNSITISRQFAPMVNQATRQAETLQRRTSNTAF